jgi:DedD protein
MDQGLKERLVGAAVLVAIAVWLIPWVLDGPESGVETAASALTLPAAEEPLPMRTQTLRLGDAPPPTPAAREAPATRSPAPAEPAQARAEPPEESELAAAAADQAAAEPREEPKSSAAESGVAAARPSEQRPAPTASAAPPKAAAAPAAPSGDWTVQLGSFGEEANARRLAQRAGTFGYEADVTSYSSGGRTLYRVRVGPQRTRAEADAAASALRAHGIKDARVVSAR